MNRREVIQKFLLGGTVMVVVPSVLTSCSKDETDDPGNNNPPPPGSDIVLDLTLPANSALNTAGNSKIVNNIIIINTGTGFVALSSICTHQGCTVAFNPGAGQLQCPCHGSVYSTSGSVINGPAPLPLQSYPVSVTDNVLTVSL